MLGEGAPVDARPRRGSPRGRGRRTAWRTPRPRPCAPSCAGRARRPRSTSRCPRRTPRCARHRARRPARGRIPSSTGSETSAAWTVRVTGAGGATVLGQSEPATRPAAPGPATTSRRRRRARPRRRTPGPAPAAPERRAPRSGRPGRACRGRPGPRCRRGRRRSQLHRQRGRRRAIALTRSRGHRVTDDVADRRLEVPGQRAGVVEPLVAGEPPGQVAGAVDPRGRADVREHRAATAARQRPQVRGDVGGTDGNRSQSALVQVEVGLGPGRRADEDVAAVLMAAPRRCPQPQVEPPGQLGVEVDPRARHRGASGRRAPTGPRAAGAASPCAASRSTEPERRCCGSRRPSPRHDQRRAPRSARSRAVGPPSRTDPWSQ